MCRKPIFSYYSQHKHEIKVARVFNTYGPHMHVDDGRVVSNLIIQALKNKDINIYGDGYGSQPRSFCYFDDLVDGLIKLMETHPDFTGPFNLGNPVEFTILELAEKVIDLTGSSSIIVYHPLPQDDPVRRKPDISLAKVRLNWQPTVELEAGLIRTVEYFEKYLRSNSYYV